LALVTTRVSCEYLAELAAFDEVMIRMHLAELLPSRVTMRFEYWRRAAQGEELVAQGEQQIACLRREGARLTPVAVPEALRQALQPYTRNHS
jgi:enediyne biosynthesis thioesterase